MPKIKQNIEINKNIDTALQACNCIRLGDVSTQTRESGGALRSSTTSFLPYIAENQNSGREKRASEAKPLLDKLAQPGTSDINSLKKRAKAKYVTRGIILPLINLKSSLEKYYWRTYHCAEILMQEGNKITGKYCNNRCCIVCARIRTAKLINEYLPVIKKEITDPYFITLTIPNIPAIALKFTVDKMIKTIIKINDTFRHRRDFRLKGIRKLECTYNPEENNYHPHFHLLINTEKAGQELIGSWLECYPQANRAAQDIRPADQHSLIEIFKYTTKIFNKKDITLEGNVLKMKVDPRALDIIFQAFQGKRIFQAMGINKLSINEDIDEIQTQEIEGLKEDIDIWVWENEFSDWINSSGEFLTACEAYKKFKIETK